MPDISKYTFKLINVRGTSKKQGTAFLISQKFAITAKHVLQTRNTKIVELHYNDRKIKARVIKSAKDLDAVILELDEKIARVDIPELNKCFNPQENPSSWFSYGFPNNYQKDLAGSNLRATRGNYSWDIDIDLDKTIQGYKGISGAPVIVDNKIIGLITTDIPNDQLGVISLKRVNSLISLDEIIKSNKDNAKRNEEEERDWSKIIGKSNYNKYSLLQTKDFENHIKKYPSGKYANEAKERIEIANKWFKAVTSNNFEIYKIEYEHSEFKEEDFDNRFYYLALKNIWTHGDTDIFPYPLENRIFKDRTEDVINALISLDKQFSKYIFKDDESTLTFDLPNKNLIETVIPIGYTGFRWVTQIEPIWNAYFLSVVLMITNRIEDKRKASSFSNSFFSYRFEPDYKFGYLFKKRKGYQFWDKSESLIKEYVKTVDSKKIDDLKNRIVLKEQDFKNEIQRSFNLKEEESNKVVLASRIKISDWLAFQIHSYEFIRNSSEYKYVVSCDIADFYNRINHSYLGDTLYSYGDVKNKLFQLIKIFSKKKSHGLPIGGNASRILAENILYDIDEFLYDNEIKFARFVDDYYIFSETENEANKYLHKFFKYLLNNKGLSLQKHKIQIYTRTEFLNSIETRLFWKSDDKEVQDKARAMALARFDYYSEDPDENEIENSINIEKLLNEELRKSRIHEQLANRLLLELSRSSKNNINDDEFNLAISKAFYSIFFKRTDRYEKDKILKLYPIFRKLLIAIKANIQKERLIKIKQNVKSGKITKDVSIDILELVLGRLLALYNDNSYIFDIELHKVYWFYLLSKLPFDYFSKPLSVPNEEQVVLKEFFKREFQNSESVFTRSWLLLNLLISNETGEINRNYESYKEKDYWEKRVYIISAPLVDRLDEGKIEESSLNEFEKIIFNWAKEIGSVEEFRRIL